MNDEELRNSVSRLLADHRAWVNHVPNDTQAKDGIETRDAIMQLIKSHTQQIALEARIDEVQQLGGSTQHGMFCHAQGGQFRPCLQCLKEARIAELKQAQEKE
jgi:hypothetical protein